MLEARNPHPRNARVRFFDDKKQHEYVIYGKDGRPKDGNRGPGATYGSVTTVCHHGFGNFDGMQIANNIAASCRPGSYYYGCTGPELTHTECPVHPVRTALVPKAPAKKPARPGARPRLALKRGRSAKTAGLAQHARFNPVAMDAHTGRLACAECVAAGLACDLKESGIWPAVRDAGTIMHEQIEDFYNEKWGVADLDAQEAEGRNDFSHREQAHFAAFAARLPHLAHYYNRRWTQAQLDAGTTSLITPELEHFLRFMHDHPHLHAYRTEWFVFDEDLRIVGAIDMLFWDDRLKRYVIYDWKRCRELRDSNYDKERGSAWWSQHVLDCNVQHYTLQLCTYALILARNYGMDIAEMWLVRCHPDAENYQKMQVFWDDAMMANMVADRMQQVAGLPAAPYVTHAYAPE